MFQFIVELTLLTPCLEIQAAWRGVLGRRQAFNLAMRILRGEEAADALERERTALRERHPDADTATPARPAVAAMRAPAAAVVSAARLAARTLGTELEAARAENEALKKVLDAERRRAPATSAGAARAGSGACGADDGRVIPRGEGIEMLDI